MAIGDAFCQIFTSAANRQPASGDGERMTLYYGEGGWSDGNMGGMYDGSTHSQLDHRTDNDSPGLGSHLQSSNMILTNSLYWRANGSVDQVISGVQIDD